MNFLEWHKQKLNEYLAEPSTFSMEMLGALKEYQLLPLFIDWGGCFAIRSDQAILSFLWDTPQEIQIETDPRIRNIVLFQGSKKYAELLALIPEKTLDARPCPACDGTGDAPVPTGISSTNFVCYCGGLGWIP